MKLNTVASLNQETGYGRMGKSLVAALQNRGVEISECTSPGDEEKPVFANGLWMGAPSHVSGWWKGQRTHVLTMWEATGVPPGFRENVHEIDTIIVPSEQNRELFSKWHPNVRKVPLGINPELWHFTERRPVDAEFRFLITGQGTRKGVDIAVAAFKEVFGGFTPSATAPIPTLTIKSRHKQEYEQGDRITLSTGTVSPLTEVEIYANAHCYLGLARGEGWGMMPFQAMAQGCPTILSDAHGHAEFAHLASTAIDCSLTKAEEFIFGDADMWWEPDFEEVCEAMWDMYINYEDYLPAAKRSAEEIAAHYTWDDSARKLIDAMGGEDALNLPDVKERQWFKPTIQQFLIIPSKNCTYEINGFVYTFKKGETYYEFGDLKRMMFEHNNLDAACLRDPNESGLTPKQLANVDRYEALNARCSACGQKFNSDMSLDFDDDDQSWQAVTV